jgi:hypothetical protein
LSVLTPNYASAATVTITMTSLGNDSWRQSAVVDNTGNKYVDALLGGSIQVGATPVNGNAITVYVYGTYDSSTYTAGASGSDAAYTSDGEAHLFLPVERIIVDSTSNQDYVFGPVSVASVFGGVLPPKWGVVVHNLSGGSLNATGTNNAIKFTGVKYDIT